MVVHGYSIALCLLSGLALAGCSKPAKQPSVMDMYELPRTRQVAPQGYPAGRPMAVDNDSYYTQPMEYKGCAVINDAPSCGGG